LKIAVHSSTGTIASKRVKTEAKRQAKRVKVDEDVESELKNDVHFKQRTNHSVQEHPGIPLQEHKN
jgi:hypothetical protein